MENEHENNNFDAWRQVSMGKKLSNTEINLTLQLFT